MEIKKNFCKIFIIFFFSFFSYSVLAEKIDDAINPFCDGNLKGEFSSNLEIEDFKIKINKVRQWNENLFKIYLDYQNKKNKSKNKNWVSNFRITDEFKKKYDAKVFIKFKQYETCEFNAKVRITGDLWWHLDWQNSSPVSSVQVQLLDGHLFNITKFKLFLKKARHSENEIFVSNFFKELGYISPKTFFIETNFNNVSVEYIFQEDIKKELIENSNYREGPIIEGDERFTVKLTEDETINYKGLNFSKVSNKKFLYKNKLNTFIGVEAISNLNKVYSYNHQYKFIEKIFDPFEDIFYLFTNKFFEKKNVELLNIFEAFSYALDSNHSLSMDDRRYYYDSYSKFYLPIYYDGKSKILNKEQYLNFDKNIENINISNEAILGAKPSLELLEKINIDNFLIKLNQSGLEINKSDLINLIEKIRGRLKKIGEINIKNFDYAENEIFFEMVEKQKIKPNFIFSDVNKLTMHSCNQNNKNCENINLTPNFLDSLNEALSQDSEKLVSLMRNKNPNIFISDKNIFKKKKFTYLNNKWKKIKFDNTIVEFINVGLDIDKNEKIIHINQQDANGKIIFLGGNLKDWRIWFKGSSDKKNKIKDFLNTGNLTGCLTFYEVLFDNVTLNSKNSDCEDSINIIRSSGIINEVFISNSFSDSLDVDFSDIIFKYVKIFDSKNDCIDFSFGNYIIDEVDLIKCGDKGASIGEKSTMQIKKLNIDKAKVGIASKDSSTTEIINADIANTEICLAAYRKKVEFSGGKLILDNVKCKYDNNFFSKDSQIIRF